MFNRTIIALDVGRSGIKAIAEAEGKRYQVLIPSIVTPATPIQDVVEAAKAEIETVVVDGEKLFCGNTARLQGRATVSTGLTSDFICTREYKALLLAAIKGFASMGVSGLVNPLIVVGMPADLFASQHHRCEEITARTINGEVKAMSQPLGAYLSYFLDERGVPQRNRSTREDGTKRSWLIVDSGQRTTDFQLIQNGTNVERLAVSCGGMQVAVDRLQQILATQGMLNLTPLICLDALITGKTRFKGKDQSVSQDIEEAVGFVVQEIGTLARNTYSSLFDELDGVLLAGGGATLIYPRLKSLLDNVILLEHPRMAVAEGYLRYARSVLLRQANKSKTMVEANG